MEWSSQTQTNAGILYNPLYEYLLVAHPDKNVYLRVAEEKQSFFDVYKEKIAVKTKPHITVACFIAKEVMEETMIRWMQRIISNQTRFIVLLNNYSGFPPHTVYLRIQDHQPFKQLASSLKVIDQYIRGNDCPPMKLVTHPHLSVARGLPKDIYEKAIIAYAQKLFSDSFEVSELVLLKRQHQFDSCKQVSKFRLAEDIRLFN
jgi:2'-5' RNA ligase